jgi:hypothetical protein
MPNQAATDCRTDPSRDDPRVNSIRAINVAAVKRRGIASYKLQVGRNFFPPIESGFWSSESQEREKSRKCEKNRFELMRLENETNQ